MRTGRPGEGGRSSPSADLATTRAHDALPAKNGLTATHVKLVEDAFERRLSELPSAEAAAPSNDRSSGSQIEGPRVIAAPESTDPARAKGRSEERRVGKEWRARSGRKHE